MNRRRSQTLLALAAGAFLAAELLCRLLPGLFGIWESRASDYLFSLRYAWFGCPASQVSTRVVHLDEDDASRRDLDLDRLPADFHEQVIELLTRIDAAAIVFDQIITQTPSGEGLAPLVRASEASGRVYFPLAVRLAPSGGLGHGVNGHGAADFLDRHLWHPRIVRAGAPLQAEPQVATSRRLSEVSRGLGSITCRPGPDGVYRRLPLLVRCRDGFLPALSLRVVCDYLRVDPAAIEVAFGRHIRLPEAHFPDGRRRDIRIPIDRQGQAIINFVAPWDAPELRAAHFTLGGLLAARQDAARLERYRDAFEETLVIYSDVTTGSHDAAPVPLDSAYYLSGIHWNLVNSVLTGRFVRDPPGWGTVLLDVALVAVLWLAGCWRRAAAFAAWALAALVACLALTAGLFFFGGVLMNGLRPVLGIIGAFGAVLLYKYVLEERERAQLRERFGNYLAPSVLARILVSPHPLEACEKKPVTVLFSDIVGFTAWSAGQPAETVRATLNAYFDAMAGVVFAHEGTIDKFMGDGLMVFFNDPLPQPDHALRAVRAAIAMQQRARELAARWEAAGGLALRIRIGLHTGEAVVGNMGSAQRFDYTAIGADVNLAQRLEREAPGGGILISTRLRDAVTAHVRLRPFGPIDAKGLGAVEAFEVVLGS